MSEFLVLFACLNSTGCHESVSHYFEQNPQVYETIKKRQKKTEKLVGHRVVVLTMPFLYVAAGGTGVVKLSQHVALSASRYQGVLSYGVEF